MTNVIDQLGDVVSECGYRFDCLIDNYSSVRSSPPSSINQRHVVIKKKKATLANKFHPAVFALPLISIAQHGSVNDCIKADELSKLQQQQCDIQLNAFPPECDVTNLGNEKFDVKKHQSSVAVSQICVEDAVRKHSDYQEALMMTLALDRADLAEKMYERYGLNSLIFNENINVIHLVGSNHTLTKLMQMYNFSLSPEEQDRAEERIVHFALNKGLRPDIVKNNSGNTMLHQDMMLRKFGKAEELLLQQCPSLISKKNYYQHTPLSYSLLIRDAYKNIAMPKEECQAIKEQYDGIRKYNVRFLLERGASIYDIVDLKQRTILSLCQDPNTSIQPFLKDIILERHKEIETEKKQKKNGESND